MTPLPPNHRPGWVFWWFSPSCSRSSSWLYGSWS
jgi:hypothetical protein